MVKKRIVAMLMAIVMVATSVIATDKTVYATEEERIATNPSGEEIETEIEEIHLDEMKDLVITGGEITKVKFIPSKSGVYSFESFESKDTYGYLYDDQMNQLEENDDSGESTNFRVTYELQEGNTYYYAARFYNRELSGIISVKLTCDEVFCEHVNTYTKEGVAATCYTNGYTESVYCSDCNKMISGEVIMAGHSDENGDGVCDLCDNTLPVAEGSCGEHVKWELQGDNSLIISGTGPMYDFYGEDGYEGEDERHAIPWRAYKNQITSVKIKEGVTKIGIYAFAFEGEDEGESRLTSVEIASSVTSIGNHAFKRCTSLKEIDLPENLTRIGNRAFGSCTNLVNVEIPTSVNTIGEEAFAYCRSLESIEIPASVRTIGSYTFEGNTSLKEVKLSEGLTEISYAMFYGCTALKEIEIPASIVSVSNRAFANCTALEKVTLSEGTTNIEEFAFENCTALHTINFPKTLKTIHTGAFSGITASANVYYAGTMEEWESVTVDSENIWLLKQTIHCSDGDVSSSIADNVLDQGKCGENAEYVLYDDYSLVINGTGSMYNFYGTDGEGDEDSRAVPWRRYKNKITSVKIENGITHIGSYAFACDGEYEEDDIYTSLESVEIPSSVTSIGKYAFYKCALLEEIELPDALKNIGNSAFRRCRSLVRMDIPDSVESIGSSVFSENISLQEVSLPEGLTNMPYSAFYGCTSLKSIEIPSTVELIGEYAFEDCTALEEVKISGTDTISLSVRVFSGCTALHTIYFPETLAAIDEGTFENTTALANVYYAGTMEEWEDVNIGSSNTYLLKQNIHCSDGDIISTVPMDVISMGKCGDNVEYTLYDTYSLVISGTGPMYNFYGVDESDEENRRSKPWRNYENEIKSVKIEEGVTSIGTNAFACDGEEEDYTSLESVEIPSSVTSIGGYAFYNCGLLTRIELPENLTSIGRYAFKYCYNLESVEIPSSVNEIGCGAFQYCDNLDYIKILNSDCVINNDYRTIPEYTFIKGYAGSTAQQYAEMHERIFVILNPDGTETYPEGVSTNPDGAEIEDIELDVYKSLRVRREKVTEVKFVPEVSGLYTFESYNEYGDPYGLLYDSDNICLQANDDDAGNRNFRLTYELEAGHTYYYGVRFYNSNDSGEITVKLTYSGEGGSATNPDGDETNPDEEATDPDGAEIEDIELDVYKTLSIVGGEVTKVRFIPEESGLYTFESYGEYGDPYGYLYDSAHMCLTEDDDAAGNYNFRLTYELEAGQTYYYGAKFSSTISGELTVKVTCAGENGSATNPDGEATNPDGAGIEDIELDVYKTLSILGGRVTKVRFVPEVSGLYTFESYNEEGDPYGYVYDSNHMYLAENDDGTGTHNFRLTYELEAGQTYYYGVRFYNVGNSGEITVKLAYAGEGGSATNPDGEATDPDGEATNPDGVEIEDIELDVYKTLSIVGGRVTKVRFVPEVSGVYTFESYNEENDPYGYVYNSNHMCLAEDDDAAGNYNFRLTYELEAGQTYYYGARFYSIGNSGEITVKLTYEGNGGSATDPDGEATNPDGEATNPDGEATNPDGEATNPDGEATNPDGVEIEDIELDVYKTLSVVGGEVTKVRFVPEVSGLYTFESYNIIGDPYGLLYDSDHVPLYTSDDADESLNFRLTYELEAGQTYYYGAKYLDEDSGEIIVKLTYAGGNGSTTNPDETECVHENQRIEAGSEPSCTEPGYTEGIYCLDCENWLVEQEEIAAKGHTAVVDDAVEATCEGTGLTEGSHCSSCGEVLVAQEEIAAKGHTTAVDEAKEATCEGTGLTEGSHCSDCGKVLVAQEEIAAKGHAAVVDDAVEATCEGTGLTEGSHCSNCGKVLVAQEEIAAKGHTTVVDDAVEATCEGTGLTEGSHCSSCGKVLVAQEEIAAKGHAAVVDDAVEATCEKAGLTEGSHCSSCGKVLVAQEEVAAKGHAAVVDDAVEATCEGTGLTEGSHCSSCGKVLVAQEEVAAKGHKTVTLNAVAATCENTGLTEGKKCSVCNTVTKQQTVIAALGHEYKVIVDREATCKQTGLQHEECNKCGDAKASTTIGTVAHKTVTLNAVAATCENTGLTEGKKCSVCNTVTKQQTVIAALGHEYKVIVDREATCTLTGLQHEECNKCGDAKASTTIGTVAHKTVTLNAVAATCEETGLTEGKKCSVCNTVTKKQNVIEALGHDTTKKVTKATLSKSGSIVTTCTTCEEQIDKETVSKVSSVKLSKTSYVYNGKEQKPTVVVKDSKGNTLKLNRDYTVTYAKGRKNVGAYKVTITLKGNYKGSKSISYKINPKATSLSSVTAGKKAFTTKWKKVTTQITGYQVQYSTSKNFTTSKIYTISKSATVSKKVSSLTARKKYYVRVRTYKVVNGTKYYSAWSTVKAVTTKK